MGRMSQPAIREKHADPSGANSSVFVSSMTDAFQRLAGSRGLPPSPHYHNAQPTTVEQTMKPNGDKPIKYHTVQAPKSTPRKKGAQIITPEEYELKMNEYRQRVLVQNNSVKSTPSSAGSLPSDVKSSDLTDEVFSEESNNLDNLQIMSVNDHCMCSSPPIMCHGDLRGGFDIHELSSRQPKENAFIAERRQDKQVDITSSYKLAAVEDHREEYVAEFELQSHCEVEWQINCGGVIPNEDLLEDMSSPSSPTSFLLMSPEDPLSPEHEGSITLISPQPGGPLFNSRILSSDASDIQMIAEVGVVTSEETRGSEVDVDRDGTSTLDVESGRREKVKIRVKEDAFEVQLAATSIGDSRSDSSTSRSDEGGAVGKRKDTLEGMEAGMDSEMAGCASRAVDEIELSVETGSAEGQPGYLPFFVTPQLFVPTNTPSEDEMAWDSSSMSSHYSGSYSGSLPTSQQSQRTAAFGGLLLPTSYRLESRAGADDSKPGSPVSKYQVQAQSQTRESLQPEELRNFDNSRLREPEGDLVKCGSSLLGMLGPKELEPEGSFYYGDNSLATETTVSRLRNSTIEDYTSYGSSVSRFRSTTVEDYTSYASTSSAGRGDYAFSSQTSMSFDPTSSTSRARNSLSPHSTMTGSAFDRGESPYEEPRILESASEDVTFEKKDSSTSSVQPRSSFSVFPGSFTPTQDHASGTDDGYDQYYSFESASSQLLHDARPSSSKGVMWDSPFDKASFWSSNGSMESPCRQRIDPYMNESIYEANDLGRRCNPRQGSTACADGDDSANCKCQRCKNDKFLMALNKNLLLNDGASLTSATEKMTDSGTVTTDSTSQVGKNLSKQAGPLTRSAEVADQAMVKAEEGKAPSVPETTCQAQGTSESEQLDHVEVFIVNDRILIDVSAPNQEPKPSQPQPRAQTEARGRSYSNEESAGLRASDNFLLAGIDPFSSSKNESNLCGDSTSDERKAEHVSLVPSLKRPPEISSIFLTEQVPLVPASQSKLKSPRETSSTSLTEQVPLVPSSQSKLKRPPETSSTSLTEQVPLVPSSQPKNKPPAETSSTCLAEPCTTATPQITSEGAPVLQKEYPLVTSLIRKVGSYDVQIIADKTRRQLMRTALSPRRLANNIDEGDERPTEGAETKSFDIQGNLGSLLTMYSSPNPSTSSSVFDSMETSSSQESGHNEESEHPKALSQGNGPDVPTTTVQAEAEVWKEQKNTPPPAKSSKSQSEIMAINQPTPEKPLEKAQKESPPRSSEVKPSHQSEPTIHISHNEVDLELAMPKTANERIDQGLEMSKTQRNSRDEESDNNRERQQEIPSHTIHPPCLTLSSASGESADENTGNELGQLLPSPLDRTHEEPLDVPLEVDDDPESLRQRFGLLLSKLPNFAWKTTPESPLCEPLLPVGGSTLENPFWMNGPYEAHKESPPAQLGLVFCDASIHDDLDLEEGRSTSVATSRAQPPPEIIFRIHSDTGPEMMQLADVQSNQVTLAGEGPDNICIRFLRRCSTLNHIWSFLGFMLVLSVLSGIISFGAI